MNKANLKRAVVAGDVKVARTGFRHQPAYTSALTTNGVSQPRDGSPLANHATAVSPRSTPRTGVMQQITSDMREQYVGMCRRNASKQRPQGSRAPWGYASTWAPLTIDSESPCEPLRSSLGQGDAV